MTNNDNDKDGGNDNFDERNKANDMKVHDKVDYDNKSNDDGNY